jgi:hypothetical protein
MDGMQPAIFEGAIIGAKGERVLLRILTRMRIKLIRDAAGRSFVYHAGSRLWLSDTRGGRQRAGYAARGVSVEAIRRCQGGLMRSVSKEKSIGLGTGRIGRAFRDGGSRKGC